MASPLLPLWSHQIQREKEAELIFRGLQYAEAIRVFQIRFRRLPVRLEELIEVKPRSIRQLWENPMSEDGSWKLLRPNQPNLPNRPIPRKPGGGQDHPPGQGTRDGDVVEVGPFTGVASSVGGDSIKTYMGKTTTSEWLFRVEDVSAMLQAPSQTFARPVNSGVFWKPFPPGVNPLNPAQGKPQNRDPDRAPRVRSN